MEQKLKIIKIINEEINKLEEEFRLYISLHKYKDAKILAKAIKRLRKMIVRIQDEV